MKLSRVHHCIEQIKVAEGTLEPPVLKKCRCKKKVTVKVATQMVKEGEASWVILKRTPGTRKVSCELCMGDPDVKNCAGCSGSGLMEISINYEDPGTDIVLVSRPPADKDEKKRSSALAAKTPRVATIEEEHMVRAYVLGFPDAAERIEEYGRLILDARMFVGKNRVPTITVEPEDDPKTGTGRRFDYGRAI